MIHGHRSLLLGTLLLSVSGCDLGYSGSSTGGDRAQNTATTGAAMSPSGTTGFDSPSTLAGSKNGVVATSSTPAVSVTPGASTSVDITFTSDDGRLISGLGITGTLSALPAGWSGPGTFSCSAVTSGSSCVLELRYAPTALDGGTLALDYVFVDNSGEPKTGAALTIPYAATVHDNVIAAAEPTGQIEAPVGTGSQTVTIGFTTDDGNAATQLALTTDLSTLPAGWTTGAAGLSCAIVSTGNGCQLTLTFAPQRAARGTLTLNYGYTDYSGAAKTGAVNLSYAATSANDVVATASPADEVVAALKSSGQPVGIVFTTDDGKPASDVSVTSDLSTLPPGWSSAASSLSCATVGSGNGCRLDLTYAPTALASGTLSLNYVYTDASGAPRSGSLEVPYDATTDDDVIAAIAPAGEIVAIAGDGSRPGAGSQDVVITFTTDDGRAATGLTLANPLETLPSGWTSPSATFGCSGIDVDTVCRLPLSYTPRGAESGTLALAFAYVNDAGDAKTGTVNIPYRATTNDIVAGTATGGPPTDIPTGDSTTVSIVFATDDGNPAGALSVSGLDGLPAGWTGASSFACPSVSAGPTCSLSLTYAPTVALASGTLALAFTYVNNAGYPQVGSVTLGYSAYTPPP